ncbi:LYR motif-containing protein 1 isoform X3 [Nycticebus coucang]|uniref:LYR motif-containing protein 1 isoform X3 n=1 Tax=Nycticebus coucang TaxID=9470 RepID=UPI00234C7E12|nr:LYR motif-containing protein 1 isoform X3 [Nycticebus coucang]
MTYAKTYEAVAKMTTATRQEVLGLYRSIFRLARRWQAASGQMEDTVKEKQYILNEARTLFQKNKNLTDTDLIKQCIDECTARIEIGLHYQIPYPRPEIWQRRAQILEPDRSGFKSWLYHLIYNLEQVIFICLRWALPLFKVGDFEAKRN